MSSATNGLKELQSTSETLFLISNRNLSLTSVCVDISDSWLSLLTKIVIWPTIRNEQRQFDTRVPFTYQVSIKKVDAPLAVDCLVWEAEQLNIHQLISNGYHLHRLKAAVHVVQIISLSDGLALTML